MSQKLQCLIIRNEKHTTFENFVQAVIGVYIPVLLLLTEEIIKKHKPRNVPKLHTRYLVNTDFWEKMFILYFCTMGK